jgi:hypothetical protein
MKSALIKMVKKRLGEVSTWKGLLSVLVGLGLTLNGEQIDLIAAAMVAVYAALSSVLPDKIEKEDGTKA